MPGDKTRDLRKVNRRSFVKTLSAMGVSASALKYLSKDALAELTDNPKDEIPVLQFLKVPASEEEQEEYRGFEDSIGRVPVYESVPRDEWMYVEAVYNGARKLHNRLINGGIGGVPVGVTTEVNGSQRKKTIIALHETVRNGQGLVKSPNISYEDLQDHIPASISGSHGMNGYETEIEAIPIKLEKVSRKENSQHYYTDKYRPVPAGCAIGGPSTTGGTLGTPATRGNDDVWVTAAHLFEDNRGGPYSSHEVHQPDETNKIGGISSTDIWYPGTGGGHADAAVIEGDGTGTDAEYDMASDSYFSDYEGWNIKGISTIDRLKLNEGNTDFQINKQGRATGRNSGYLIGVYETTDRMTINAASSDGDSGGPYFEYIDGDVYIAGIHGEGGAGSSSGTIMESIEGELNVSVGPHDI